MLKIAALFILLFSGTQSYANEKLLCSFYYMDKYHDEVNKLPGSKDKLKHCTLSCMVAKRCPSFEVELVGILKELYDIFGPGNYELEDLEANRRGIRFSNTAQNNAECFRFCKQVY